MPIEMSSYMNFFCLNANQKSTPDVRCGCLPVRARGAVRRASPYRGVHAVLVLRLFQTVWGAVGSERLAERIELIVRRLEANVARVAVPPRANVDNLLTEARSFTARTGTTRGHPVALGDRRFRRLNGRSSRGFLMLMRPRKNSNVRRTSCEFPPEVAFGRRKSRVRR